ncbi:unnamed protein product [Prunus armeniaca]|uniref:Uncharacterized protein n=1 Tax=Prunus armeniaca TaxID=36596 RepID=A0A6J5WB97_PRUAR|nr:hypothetical protein GBA52_000700 [Prunus armeniaca]CAB4267165.1 unnamed protein product [Prunus armeniaca]CAB4297663.1 unnamed protein product [Prunus armeniaca]
MDDLGQRIRERESLYKWGNSSLLFSALFQRKIHIPPHPQGDIGNFASSNWVLMSQSHFSSVTWRHGIGCSCGPCQRRLNP